MNDIDRFVRKNYTLPSHELIAELRATFPSYNDDVFLAALRRVTEESLRHAAELERFARRDATAG